MPSSLATCAIDLPLVCTSRTASSLNSFVNVRCSFGIVPLPFCGGVYSNFPSSTKLGPAHIKQVPEPEGIEAAGDYDIIILILFHLAVIFAFNLHGCVIGVNAPHGAKHRAYVLGITELFHRLEREDATIGASHKFAPVALAQLQPVRSMLVVAEQVGKFAIGVRKKPVLLKTLIA